MRGRFEGALGGVGGEVGGWEDLATGKAERDMEMESNEREFSGVELASCCL